MTSTAPATADYDLTYYRKMTQTWNNKPLSHLERYYTKYVNDRQPHMYIRQAPNGIIVVGVRYLTTNQTTSTVQVELAFDLVGKKVTPGSMIARVNGEPVYAKVHGTLMEVNERLIEEPELLLNDSTVQGYVGIIKPKSSGKKIHEFSLVDEL